MEGRAFRVVVCRIDAKDALNRPTQLTPIYLEDRDKLRPPAEFLVTLLPLYATELPGPADRPVRGGDV